MKRYCDHTRVVMGSAPTPAATTCVRLHMQEQVRGVVVRTKSAYIASPPYCVMIECGLEGECDVSSDETPLALVWSQVHMHSCRNASAALHSNLDHSYHLETAEFS